MVWVARGRVLPGGVNQTVDESPVGEPPCALHGDSSSSSSSSAAGSRGRMGKVESGLKEKHAHLFGAAHIKWWQWWGLSRGWWTRIGG